ncbi:MAG: 5-formyltetrahydrofolate cyclo-ligase [Betaproteobacteria bacterium]|nr:MAG: 5-formyltetrahydrofolate cyclo-ligase [Betaproteobacteria bacterium]
MDEQTLKTWRTALRAELIARRLAANPEDRRRWNDALDAHIEALLADVAEKIIAFCWPYQAEYDARSLILRFLGHGARAALPVVVASRQPMVFRQWTPETRMVAGVYDIPVPADSPEVVPDVALIALAGFDDAGYRLGYGAGFFDRTLAVIEPRPMTVGVGFELARVPTIYPQWHDIPLDYVVTEVGIRRREAGSVMQSPPTAQKTIRN